MNQVVAILASIAIGILGVVFGLSQRGKRKAAEEESERLSAELEQKGLQSQVASILEADHTDAIGEVAEAGDSEIAGRANSLFGADSLGDMIKELRTDRSMSLISLSRKTGYAARELADFERGKGVTKDVIKRLSKAYGLTKEKERSLLDKLKEEA